MSNRVSVGVSKALELVSKGWTVRQAASATGVWPSSIYTAARRLGLTLQREDQGVTARTHMVVFKPGTDKVKAVKWPASLPPGWRAIGACDQETREAGFERRKAVLFIEAMHMIVRDKCNPEAVHKAMCEFLEYRDGLSSDMPGASA